MKKIARVGSVALILSSQAVNTSAQGLWVSDEAYKNYSTPSLEAETGSDTGANTGTDTGSDTGTPDNPDTGSEVPQPTITDYDVVSSNQVISNGVLYFKGSLTLYLNGQNFNSYGVSLNGVAQGDFNLGNTDITGRVPSEGLTSVILTTPVAGYETIDLLAQKGVSSIKEDSQAPKITYKIEEGVKTDIRLREVHEDTYYKEKPTISIEVSDEGAGVSSYEVLINGEVSDNYDLDTAKVNPDNPFEYRVEVTATDELGNESTEEFVIYYAKEFYKDLKVVQGGVELSLEEVNNLVSGENVYFTFENYKNLPLRQLYLLKDDEKSQLSVKTIDTDKHETTKTTVESGEYKLVGLLEDGVTEIDILTGLRFNIEAELPIITRTSDIVAGKKGDIDVYPSKPVLSYNLEDNNGIDTYELTINGVSQGLVELNGAKNHVLDIELPDGVDAYEVIVRVVDINGNTSDNTYSFEVDTYEETDVHRSIVTSYFEHGDAIYAKTPISYDILPVRDEDSILGASSGELSDTAPTYSIKYASGKTSADLNVFETLFPGKTALYIDSSEPVATFDIKGNSRVIDDTTWYEDVPTVNINLSDNLHLYTYKLTVNGVSGEPVVIDGNVGSFTVPVESLTGTEQSIEIEVTDKAGNVTLSSVNFNIDTTDYGVRGLAVDTPYTIREDELFFADPFKLSLRTDSNTLSHAIVYKDGVEVGQLRNGTDLEISDTGAYTVKFVSIFGSEGDEMDLGKALIGSRAGIRFDKEAPTNTLSAKDPDSNFGGNRWYRSVPTMTVGADDNYALIGVQVRANGVTVLDVNDIQGTSFKDTIDIDPNLVDNDGLLRVEVVSIDIAGVKTTNTYNFYVETGEIGIVSAEPRGDYNAVDDVVYSAGNFGVSITPATNRAGYSNIEFLDADGNVVHTVGYTDMLSEFPADAVAFRLVSNLGDATDSVTLSSIFGGSSVVIDTEEPTLNLELPDGIDLSGSTWFKQTPRINVTGGDNTGILNIVARVNGNVVLDKGNSGSSLSEALDLSGVSVNSDGSYNIVVEVTDFAGNTQSVSRTVYVDGGAPVVNGFNFIQEGYKEGRTLTTDMNTYGFFFQGSTSLDISVSDTGASAGVSEVRVTFNGTSNNSVTVPVSGGVARVQVPNNFKGFISAVAVDAVGNESTSANPDGVITEDANWSVSTSRLEISLPSTGNMTSTGIPLFNTDITVTGSYSLPISGLRSINWNVNGAGVGGGASSTGQDLNLNVSGTSSIGVSGNSNNIPIELVAVDGAGHTSRTSAVVAIDKDAPVINVTYNTTNANNLYNSNRVATITIQERNFRASDVQITGNPGAVSWVSNGDTHTGTITFAEDGTYSWGLTYTDMAGNAGQAYRSEEFIVDKSAPVLSISWDNNVSRNGFFKESRTATLRVQDRNFSGSRIQVSGATLTTPWVSQGDVHTATIVFDKDGTYAFRVSGTDLAGNEMNTITVPEFKLDATKPDVRITGITPGASYSGQINGIVEFSDVNLNLDSVKVKLVGVKNGEISLKGDIQDGKLVLENLPNEAKYDDVYTLTVEVSDLAGNVTEEVVKFMVNRFGSTFKWVTEEFIGKYIREVTKGIVLEETSITKLDLDKTIYTIQLNGKRVNTDKKPKATREDLGEDINLYRYIFPSEIFNEDGLWTLGVSSTDEFGKNSNSSETRMEFILDSKAPTVEVSGVSSDGELQHSDGRVTVVYNDNIKVKSVKYVLNNVETSIEDLESGTFDINLPIDGTSDLTIEVEDMTGQKAIYNMDNVQYIGSTVAPLMGVGGTLGKIIGGILGAGLTALGGMFAFLLFKNRKEREELNEQLDIESDTGSSTDVL